MTGKRQVSPRISAEFINDGFGPIRFTHNQTGEKVSVDDALAMIARDHHISKSQAADVVKRELLFPVRHNTAKDNRASFNHNSGKNERKDL